MARAPKLPPDEIDRLVRRYRSTAPHPPIALFAKQAGVSETTMRRYIRQGQRLRPQPGAASGPAPDASDPHYHCEVELAGLRQRVDLLRRHCFELAEVLPR